MWYTPPSPSPTRNIGFWLGGHFGGEYAGDFSGDFSEDIGGDFSDDYTGIYVRMICVEDFGVRFRFFQ